MNNLRSLIAVARLALGAGCGNGSGSTDDDGTTDVVEDSSSDSVGELDSVDDVLEEDDATTDAMDSVELAIECTGHGDCDDYVDCTVDTCEEGLCLRVPDHTSCDTVEMCHPESGCRAATGWLCLSCEGGALCDRDDDLCARISGVDGCVPPRSDDRPCPDGLTCQEVQDESGTSLGNGCVPVGGECCWDIDGDVAGIGDGCAAFDCDELSTDVHEGADELCNNIDDDCDGEVDGIVTDCAASTCETGDEGYELVTWVCEEGACVEAPFTCGPYTCEGGADTGDVCAVICTDATTCTDDAHCDTLLGVCEFDFDNGSSCVDPIQCASGYCNSGLCCPSGTCCSLPGHAEVETCGACGEGWRDRSCQTDYSWSSWTSCMGAGCSPGATRLCGLCGTQTCESDCDWNYCNFGTTDGWEYNDSYYVNGGTISDCDGSQVNIYANLNPAYDSDMYWVRINEDFWCTWEPRMSLSLPWGVIAELNVNVWCSGDSSPRRTYTYTVQRWWTGDSGYISFNFGTCGGADPMYLYIQVMGINHGAGWTNVCDNYHLYVNA